QGLVGEVVQHLGNALFDLVEDPATKIVLGSPALWLFVFPTEPEALVLRLAGFRRGSTVFGCCHRPATRMLLGRLICQLRRWVGRMRTGYHAASRDRTKRGQSISIPRKEMHGMILAML